MFDTEIDRAHTGCLKYGALAPRWGRTDLQPLWVADMDFRTPDFVTSAIQKKIDEGVLGYESSDPEWRPAIIDWQRSRHQWDVSPESIGFVPGIVRGIAFALLAFTQKGDKVLVMDPVYHPFFLVTANNGREVVRTRLEIVNGEFQVDWADFESKVSNGVKVFILSNPHNPGGRVWRAEELARMADICHRHHVLVLSDEIHADLTFEPLRHIPFATVSAQAAEISITFGSPSKAFNCPGIVTSYSIIENDALRKTYANFLSASELDEGNMFAQAAAVAAYTHGETWLDEAKKYIWSNVQYACDRLRSEVSGIEPIVPEASFLVWLDCRQLFPSHEAIRHFFIDEAHLALDDGLKFGPAGEGFMRLNVATPRTMLQKAIDKIAKAYVGLQQ